MTSNRCIKVLSSVSLIAACLLPLSTNAQSIASRVENMGQARHLEIRSMMAKERNGFLAVQFEVANTDSDPQRMFWRMKWLDADGFQVWDDEAWKPLLLQARAQQNIIATAPTPKARDFRVQFAPESNWSLNTSTPFQTPMGN